MIFKVEINVILQLKVQRSFGLTLEDTLYIHSVSDLRLH